MKQHGRLLYHAFHFWRGGKRVVELQEQRLRSLLDGDGDRPAGAWTLATPTTAGYFRLPRNLIWASPSPGLRPEPADGFFWTFPAPRQDARLPDARRAAAAGPEAAAPEAMGGGAPVIHLLLALGVRPDRPGFSVVSATGVADREPHWADVDARPGGRDFHTTLPGGELDRLYSVETTAELLKLASLAFRELERGG
jgi:hypothetical protein